ncbi:YkyA family protein [Virgibacillus siamensis]|uniref:YkyA family protein n=1 Tax=Virgibacillus siamensis TaxID=480071 RepID=UPI0011156F27|nr:YkyA family protein [Virgibacillus siamensis]
MNLKKLLSFILILFLLTALTACNSASASDKIYNHLEKSVELEKTFEKQQNPIVKLEKKEQKIYSEIIDLKMDEFDKIKKLSQRALKSIEKRSKKIEMEKDSIHASKEEFKKIDDLIGNLEDGKAKKTAEKMFNVMMDRYKAYDVLYDAYEKSLKLETKLYKLLQKEDLEQKALTKNIKRLNKSYEKVLDANKKFNSRTAEYNELKEKFYELAEINVDYEEKASSVEDK